MMPHAPFVGSFHGGRLEVHPGEVASSSAFYIGFYEREVTMWAIERLRRDPPSLVVDVGANFGYYPLLFGLLSCGATRTIAFEPDPRNFAWLARNLALNPGLSVIAEQIAVGDVACGSVPFEAASDGHNLWSRIASDRPNEHPAETIDVPCTTLDAYFADHGIKSVDIALIDVEGHESKVVEGMRQSIAERQCKSVMVEFHPWAFAEPEQEAQAIADVFLSAGYVAKRFAHVTGPTVDKDPSFYRLAWNESLLRPLSYDGLSDWEHFLFEVP